MSINITIEIVESDVDIIQDMGYTPGEYLKMILEKDLKKVRSKQALDWLQKNRIEADGKPSEDIIREGRDTK